MPSKQQRRSETQQNTREKTSPWGASPLVSPLTGYVTKALRTLLREVNGRQFHRSLVAIEDALPGDDPLYHVHNFAAKRLTVRSTATAWKRHAGRSNTPALE